MDKYAHGKLEQLWDDAVTPVALRDKIISRSWAKDRVDNTKYSDAVSFCLNDCKKDRAIRIPIISGTGLMTFMIDVCIESKKRGWKLFPLDNPKKRNDDILAKTTREIFADCIGNLMAVWRYIWVRHQE